ncbi:MAG: nucleoside hydrolase [Chitinivibrionales bacterium]|nr:nucleoside hydrolase [Chitinivibrionales bacterium]
MKYPEIPEPQRLTLLTPPSGKTEAVLDTDTYNEIDDQFALTHALLSPEHIDLRAVYAAPYHNQRSTGPGDGMEKSYEEILRILKLCGRSDTEFAFRGSPQFIAEPDTPVVSPAAEDLIKKAQQPRDKPLYVLTIGAPTNVSSAIMMEPDIIKNIVVVWLGGAGLDWFNANGFNLQQDMIATRVLLDSGVPLVHLGMWPVTSHIVTTGAEVEQCLRGKNDLADYLADIFREYVGEELGVSKVLWDLAATAYLIDPGWVPTALIHSPLLTDTDPKRWAIDTGRHFIRDAKYCWRDAIFRDLFAKIAAFQDG